METTLGIVRGKPVTIAVRDGIVFLNDEVLPIKNIGESDLIEYQGKVDSLPSFDEEGRAALKNALTAEFLVKLLSNAVGDDCVTRLTRLLDHFHYDVLTYLGETGE